MRIQKEIAIIFLITGVRDMRFGCCCYAAATHCTSILIASRSKRLATVETAKAAAAATAADQAEHTHSKGSQHSMKMQYLIEFQVKFSQEHKSIGI